MRVEVQKVRDLKHRWSKLDGDKSSIMTLCEQYASWTLPWAFPPIGTVQSTEMQFSNDSIGAQAVSHLANKLVSVLFPGQRMFFRLRLNTEAEKLIRSVINPNGQDSDDAEKAVQEAIADFKDQMVNVEREAQEYMDMVSYRPQAVLAATYIIITGNALMFHPPGRPVQVYNLRDYCIQRDLSGQVIEIMTKECKAFETFIPAIQEQLIEYKDKPHRDKDNYSDRDNITIYTQIKLEDDGKYHVYQCAEHVLLDTDGAVWTKKELPWIPLTWNLVRGEDYGRGRVADFAGAFHAVNVLSGSLLNIAAIMGDIKFLVNPASTCDVVTLNKSPAGSYHNGKKDDITTIQVDKMSDAQFIATMIDRSEKQIAQAFLLNSQLTRNAERVTAEEIRRDANELETSNGGVYSRQASEWQVPTANIVLHQIDFDGLDYGIIPQIITGMDSLSRSGELENILIALNSAAVINGVPEDMREYIKKGKLWDVIFRNSQVESSKEFISTEEEVAQERQKAYDQAMALEEKKALGQAQAGMAQGIAKETANG